MREDMRMASVVLNILSAFCASIDAPDLLYPYILSPEAQAEEAHAILAYKKAKYGDVAGQHGDSPGT